MLIPFLGAAMPVPKPFHGHFASLGDGVEVAANGVSQKCEAAG
jgi:hypothetical protein